MDNITSDVINTVAIKLKTGIAKSKETSDLETMITNALNSHLVTPKEVYDVYVANSGTVDFYNKIYLENMNNDGFNFYDTALEIIFNYIENNLDPLETKICLALKESSQFQNSLKYVAARIADSLSIYQKDDNLDKDYFIQLVKEKLSYINLAEETTTYESFEEYYEYAIQELGIELFGNGYDQEDEAILYLLPVDKVVKWDRGIISTDEIDVPFSKVENKAAEIKASVLPNAEKKIYEYLCEKIPEAIALYPGPFSMIPLRMYQQGVFEPEIQEFISRYAYLLLLWYFADKGIDEDNNLENFSEYLNDQLTINDIEEEILSYCRGKMRTVESEATTSLVYDLYNLDKVKNPDAEIGRWKWAVEKYTGFGYDPNIMKLFVDYAMGNTGVVDSIYELLVDKVYL